MEHFIKNIEITNFKSIRHAAIKDCRRVNVFVGYPNVGKSNILEALSLFNVDNLADTDLRQYWRFENYTNLFFNNNFKSNIEVNLKGLEKIELKFKKQELHLRSESNKMFYEMEIPLNQFEVNAMTHGSNSSDYYDSVERLQIKKYSFNTKINDSINYFSGQLKFPSGSNLSEVISLNQHLKKEVVDLFKRFNLKYATDENNLIKVVREYGDQEVKIFPYLQIADTLRRLIFYKAAILSNQRAILLLEEPEAHMFPPYISQLTSDIIQDKNQNQFFIATHSPFVLNDFMEDLKDEELSIYAVGLEDGETTIRKLTDEDVTEIYQYGVDLFFNLEDYLKDAVS